MTACEEGVAVGIVGASEPSELAEALSRRDETYLVGDAERVCPRARELVVAVGREALLAVANERPGVPVLPVETGRGVTSIDRVEVPTALDAVFDGDREERRHPLFSVEVGGESVGSSFGDVTLVTSEPARISEFAIDHGRRVATVRADGVVIATPAGSAAYATDAGGPVLAPGIDAVSVVPIAPFHTRDRRWILDPEHLSVSVLRDEERVSLRCDGSERATLTPPDRLTLTREATVRTVLPRADQKHSNGPTSDTRP
ncbi:NAD(+)/NADH kinase [Natronorarus salvus]|uniref:ATP-NAD kinase n=1 Tax=Natronorarus salvus TaxID=3117733 RepID=UPI002F2614C8